jgi:hypothetical protein
MDIRAFMQTTHVVNRCERSVFAEGTFRPPLPTTNFQLLVMFSPSMHIKIMLHWFVVVFLEKAIIIVHFYASAIIVCMLVEPGIQVHN